MGEFPDAERSAGEHGQTAAPPAQRHTDAETGRRGGNGQGRLVVQLAGFLPVVAGATAVAHPADLFGSSRFSTPAGHQGASTSRPGDDGQVFRMDDAERQFRRQNRAGRRLQPVATTSDDAKVLPADGVGPPGNGDDGIAATPSGRSPGLRAWLRTGFPTVPPTTLLFGGAGWSARFGGVLVPLPEPFAVGLPGGEERVEGQGPG
jgi:hypothetical protein